MAPIRPEVLRAARRPALEPRQLRRGARGLGPRPTAAECCGDLRADATGRLGATAMLWGHGVLGHTLDIEVE